MNIIYIEDDPDTADITKLMLESGGFHVDVALTGHEGLQLMKKNTYDLILLDMMLPDMSGIDFFNKVKSKKTVCAMLSALPLSNEKREELMDAGIVDCITKPFKKEELLEKIHRITKTPRSK